MKIIESILKNFNAAIEAEMKVSQDSGVTLQERKDVRYNRIARDQPAYIALLYPLLCILIGLDFGKMNLNGSVGWIYLINLITSLSLFLPALFFLFKMLTRDISEVIVEKISFAILGQPTRFVIRKTFRWFRLSDSDCKKVRREAQTIFNIVNFQGNEDFRNRWKERTDKNLNEGLDRLHHRLKSQSYIKDDPIAFEYNCIYGFYRNLAGGLFINLILICCVLIFCTPVNTASDTLVTTFNTEAVLLFVKNSWPWILSLLILMIILAYFARIKHIKKQFHLFLIECDSTLVTDDRPDTSESGTIGTINTPEDV